MVKKAFLKAGLVDLWKWRVWVQQKEEALLKVETNSKYGKATDIRRQARLALIANRVLLKDFVPQGTNIAFEEPPATAALTLDDVQVEFEAIFNIRCHPHLCC